MSTLRERLIGALNSNPGVVQTSVDGTERYIHARTSEVADAVLTFLGLHNSDDPPALLDARKEEE